MSHMKEFIQSTSSKVHRCTESHHLATIMLKSTAKHQFIHNVVFGHIYAYEISMTNLCSFYKACFTVVTKQK